MNTKCEISGCLIMSHLRKLLSIVAVAACLIGGVTKAADEPPGEVLEDQSLAARTK